MGGCWGKGPGLRERHPAAEGGRGPGPWQSFACLVTADPSCAPGCVLGLEATAGSTMTESLPPGVYSLVFSALQGCGRREDTPKEMHGNYSLFDSDTGQEERCAGSGGAEGLGRL